MGDEGEGYVLLNETWKVVAVRQVAENEFEITSDDTEFPDSLRKCVFDNNGYERAGLFAGETLYVKGNLELFYEPLMVVSGARRATPYGMATANMAGKLIAEGGGVLMNGGGIGCDLAAIRACREAGGKAVIVSGTGADWVYPKSAERDWEDLWKHGCVVSMRPWGAQPTPSAFRSRQRLIAEMASFVLASECGRMSGTFAMAEHALESDVPTYAIPGSIFSNASVGCNDLIAGGARPIVSVQDLAAELHSWCERLYGAVFKDALSMEGAGRETRDQMLLGLVASPMNPVDLAGRTGKSYVEVLRELASLERDGLVTRLPDGYYTASERLYLQQVGCTGQGLSVEER